MTQATRSRRKSAERYRAARHQDDEGATLPPPSGRTRRWGGGGGLVRAGGGVACPRRSGREPDLRSRWHGQHRRDAGECHDRRRGDPVRFLETIQLENRDGSITIIDGTGTGEGDPLSTQVRDSDNPETNSDGTPQQGGGKEDGLWTNYEGTGYLDMGGNGRRVQLRSRCARRRPLLVQLPLRHGERQ